MSFILFFMILSFSCGFLCHCLGTTFCFHLLVATFYLYVNNSNRQSIFDEKDDKSYYSIMLQNLNHKYSSHYSIVGK